MEKWSVAGLKETNMWTPNFRNDQPQPKCGPPIPEGVKRPEPPPPPPPPPLSTEVDHPLYYGGKGDPYEAIKVIEAWRLGFHLGNCVKYICRAGMKTTDRRTDLLKAQWYLNRAIEWEDGKK